MRVFAVLLCAVPVAVMVWGMTHGDRTYPCCEPSGHRRLYWWDEQDFQAEERAHRAHRHKVTVTREPTHQQPPETGSHIPPAVIQGIVLHSEHVQVDPGQLELEDGQSAD